jgi:hypothetical protein
MLEFAASPSSKPVYEPHAYGYNFMGRKNFALAE